MNDIIYVLVSPSILDLSLEVIINVVTIHSIGYPTSVWCLWRLYLGFCSENDIFWAFLVSWFVLLWHQYILSFGYWTWLMEVILVWQAYNCYLEALRMQPNFAIAWSNLAGLFMEAGDLNRALLYYKVNDISIFS